MKFCKYCGAQIKDEAQFCPQCGKNLGVRTEPAAPPRQNNYNPQPASAPSSTGSNNTLAIVGVIALAIVVLAGIFFFTGRDKKEQTARSTAPAQTQKAVPQTPKQQAAAPSGSQLDAKAYVAVMYGFNDRLKVLADRINSGVEDSYTLKAVGNVLKDDIRMEQNKLKGYNQDARAQKVKQLLGIQWKRADCMVRGLNGVEGAYAEGGGYYDEFQEQFGRFKAEIGM